MPRVSTHAGRSVVAGFGIGALAFGPGAAATGASGPGTGAPATPPPAVALSDGRSVSRWAYPQAATVVRNTPSAHARAVGRLHFLTEDGQAEVYMALSKQYQPRTGLTWIKVALPKRPNGVTGWVPARALGPRHLVYGRLVINRSLLCATLYERTGRAIWRAPAGVGRPSLPTPAGRFYVREKLRAIGSPTYGPYAIGTSAYAPTLTDWPGGGIVGIHGTDQPQLIPGRPSHGCVRLRNRDITRLWRLIRIGTPIDII